MTVLLHWRIWDSECIHTYTPYCLGPPRWPLVAAQLFLKFWRQTRDGLFLLFSIAFGVDAAMLLGLSDVSAE